MAETAETSYAETSLNGHAPAGTLVSSGFVVLNERYTRFLDDACINYCTPHVSLYCKSVRNHLSDLSELITKYTGRGWFAVGPSKGSSKKLMMLRLIAAQLEEVLRIWASIEADNACIDARDVNLCDALDTLWELEDTAEQTGIPEFKRLIVPGFDDTQCPCSQCLPTQEYQRTLWQRVQDYNFQNNDVAPAMFERVFSRLRESASAENNSHRK